MGPAGSGRTTPAEPLHCVVRSTSTSLPPRSFPRPLKEGTMIWKRSAVLRFYSVCGLLLQGNPRPAVGSIASRPFPILPIPPRISTLPWQSPSARRFPVPPPPPRCCRGQWQFAPAVASPALAQPSSGSIAGSSLRGTFRLFIHLSCLHSTPLDPRQHPPPTPGGWQLVPVSTFHSPILPPTLASHLPHHALKRPFPPLVISLTSSPFRVAFPLSLLPTSILSMCL